MIYSKPSIQKHQNDYDKFKNLKWITNISLPVRLAHFLLPELSRSCGLILCSRPSSIIRSIRHNTLVTFSHPAESPIPPSTDWPPGSSVPTPTITNSLLVLTPTLAYIGNLWFVRSFKAIWYVVMIVLCPRHCRLLLNRLRIFVYYVLP